MSKCMVGRSMRVYTVLLFGTALGFAISTLLQSFSYSDFSRTAGILRGGMDYPLQVQGGKASFSNLDTRASEGDEQIDIGGYYDYERLVLRGEVETEERGRGDEEERGELEEGEREAAWKQEKLSDPVQDSKMKQREYMSDAWQGRNVRETNDGKPLIKLSDELAPRNTLLIGVITSVMQLMSQTLAIQGTWAAEASQVIYFTGEVETLPHLPHGMVVVQLEGLNDKQAGWDLKELTAISYVSTHYLDNTDWFLIVADDTYVSSTALEKELNKYDASMSVYMGRPLEGEEGQEGERNADKLCDSASGVVYSRGFLERLKPYLPVCWPSNGGEMKRLSGCVSVMGLKCTSARQVSFIHTCAIVWHIVSFIHTCASLAHCV